MNLSELETKYANPEFTPGLEVPSKNKWREFRVKRGYVVHNDSAESAGRAFQSMSFTGPYVPNSLESYSKKIGPSCLFREGCGNDDEVNSKGSFTGLIRKRNNETNQGTTWHLKHNFVALY
jgi:hypothetical protein